jgi:hypothetical protein
MRPVVTILVVLLTGLPQVVQARSRTIHATQTANCNDHPEIVTVAGPATVTCLNATQSIQQQGKPPASCYISGPGVAQEVLKDGNVATNGPGKVTLTCHGSGSLACSARIED